MHNWPKPLKFKSEAIAHQLLGTFLCHRVPVLLAHVFLNTVKPPETHKAVPFFFRFSCYYSYLYFQYYLFIPWIRVLLQKLTSSQLVKNFTTFYRTQSFMTAFTLARHLSKSWATSIQSISPNPTSWRSVVILFFHLCLDFQNGFSFRFPHQNPV